MQQSGTWEELPGEEISEEEMSGAEKSGEKIGRVRNVLGRNGPEELTPNHYHKKE
jgi:hypothetical protein